MGSLSNLYISQSYISLIHLGSNNTASSTPTELQDGLGNGVGVSVSTNKNLYVSGNVYAANLTGSTIDTGSLLVTASFNNGTRNLTFTKGDTTTFNVNIPDVSGSTINTGSFATTGSNTFTGVNNFSSSVDILGGLNLYDNGMFLGLPKNMGDPFQNIGVYTPFVYAQSGGGKELVLGGDFMGNKGVSIRNGLTITGSLFVAPSPGMIPTPNNITASGNISASGNIYAANLTGSTIDTGSLVTTSSFNSYTASQDFKNTTFATTSSVTNLSASLYFTDTTQSNNIANNSSSIGLLQTFSGSQYKNDSSSFDSRILAITSSGGTIYTGSFAITSSNTFTGDQTILGSIVSNPTTSLTKLFSQAFVSGATQYNITASAAVSQSNIVFGGTPLASTQNGSVILSGSGNLLFNPSKISTGLQAFNRGYVGGNNNYFTTIPTLHTQSLFNPTISNNIGTGLLAMNFITSSLGVPTISNNNFSSTITLNHQSGTVSMQNNISNGTITSNQNGLTSGTIAATFNSNIIGGGGLTLNHNSSSIITTTNTLLGVTTVTNNYYHTGSGGNSISLTNNITNGQAITITAAGNPATDITRPIANNLLGGQTIAVSAQAAGTDLGGLRSGIIYGYNLIVSGAHATATTTNQGTAYFGRYNDINAGLADSGKTIFAVGTGTSTSARKTALSVDSSSVVMVSGSLSVTGSTTINGSLIVTGSNTSIDSNGNVTASTFLATSNGSTAFVYNQQSTGSVAGVWNTNYGKDGLQIYQYQGQPYAFNVILTANQINAYTGSEFQWGLQTNGTLNLPGGGSTYFAMSSGSTITGSGGGANKVGLDYLETAMILDMKADTSFNRRVYVDKGMYVSQSVGGSQVAALTVNGTNASNNTAISATGSVRITGSLSVSNTASFNAPVVINNNSDLYLYGHKQFNVGAFYSTVTQSGSAGVSQSMQFEVTDLSYGVSMVSNSRITLANAGTYNIQFSTQLLADSGADNVWIWLKKNGTNVSATAGHVVLANNDELIAAWNYVIDAAANDYYELAWQSSGGDAVLLAEVASGNIPSIPSTILTVTQVR